MTINIRAAQFQQLADSRAANCAMLRDKICELRGLPLTGTSNEFWRYTYSELTKAQNDMTREYNALLAAKTARDDDDKEYEPTAADEAAMDDVYGG